MTTPASSPREPLRDEEISAQLAALPELAMPEAVESELHALLTAPRIPPSETAPHRASVRSPRRRRDLVLAGVASLAVLLLAGVAVAALLRSEGSGGEPAQDRTSAQQESTSDDAAALSQSESRGASATTSPQGAPAAPQESASASDSQLQVIASGIDYHQSSLSAQLKAVNPAPISLSEAAALAPALAALTDTTRLAACLSEVSVSQLTVGLDFASYEGSPALVIVAQSEEVEDEVGVVIVGPGCSAGNADMKFAVVIPMGSG